MRVQYSAVLQLSAVENLDIQMVVPTAHLTARLAELGLDLLAARITYADYEVTRLAVCKELFRRQIGGTR